MTGSTCLAGADKVAAFTHRFMNLETAAHICDDHQSGGRYDS